MSRPQVPLNLLFPDRTAAGISKNADGERVVAASRRADGTVRKELRIRPGFTPQEDVALYRSRGAVEAERRQAQRERGVVPGLRPATAAGKELGGSGGGKKRSRGKKGGKKLEEGQGEGEVPESWDDNLSASTPSTATPASAEVAAAAPSSSSSTAALPPPVPAVSTFSSSASSAASTTAFTTAAAQGNEKPTEERMTPEEREKRARALRKKLRQAEQLRDRTLSSSLPPSSTLPASSSPSSSIAPPAPAPAALSPAEQEKVASIARLLEELRGLKLTA